MWLFLFIVWYLINFIWIIKIVRKDSDINIMTLMLIVCVSVFGPIVVLSMWLADNDHQIIIKKEKKP